MDKFDRLDRKLVHKGTIINMYEDTVRVSNGNVVHWDFIGHNGAAAVIPVTKDGKIVLVKQWRNALDRFTYEIPAGGLNPGEKMIDAAARELEEETGYKSSDLELLISLRTTVAFCNEKIEVYEFEIKEHLDMIKSCEIEDSKTVSAILAYYSFYVK